MSLKQNFLLILDYSRAARFPWSTDPTSPAWHRYPSHRPRVGTSSTNHHPTTSAPSSPPSTPSNTSNKHTSKTSPGVIAGVVVGALALSATALGAYLCVSRRSRGGYRRGLDSPQVESQTLPEIQQRAGTPAVTVLAFDRPMAPGVVESQEAMMFKIEGLRRDMHSARGSPAQSRVDVQTGRGQVDMEQQFRDMAERMAQMEAQMRMNEAPPGYTPESPL
ncbi:hypothetical protein DFH09DRAFT_462394 [Mycena vulgaris]|nr:hypothetical protein DFH09DRAFT_462394 [Mycena vulgaris]